MINRQTAIKIRKADRYLGIFLGIQFLMWTISSIYFSWTDIDEIHGDQFKNPVAKSLVFDDLISPTVFKDNTKIASLELRDIAGKPYYWINKKTLVNARTRDIKKGVSEKEALAVAGQNMLSELKASWSLLITNYDLELLSYMFIKVKDKHDFNVDALLRKK